MGPTNEQPSENVRLHQRQRRVEYRGEKQMLQLLQMLLLLRPVWNNGCAEGLNIARRGGRRSNGEKYIVGGTSRSLRAERRRGDFVPQGGAGCPKSL